MFEAGQLELPNAHIDGNPQERIANLILTIKNLSQKFA